MHTSLRPWPTVTTGLAAVMLLSACAPAVSPVQNDAPTTAFAHVHSLEIDPASGELLVATHEGIFAVDVTSSTANVRGPLGGLDFDPMGFTIADGVAFASGHPGPTTPSEFGNPNLGLIRSEDGGRSWVTVSLRGETDFHALTIGVAPSGGKPVVYGLDSSIGIVRRSEDGGVTWANGATIAARTILADTLTAAVVYATTADGFALSADGAATFAVDANAPVLYLVTSGPEGSLFGIDTLGSLWSRDAAGSWTSGGEVTGTPQALLVAGERIYVADDRGLVYTDDRGASWVVVESIG